MMVIFYICVAMLILLLASPVLKHVFEQPTSLTPVLFMGRIRDNTLVVDSVKDGKIRIGDIVNGKRVTACIVTGFESGSGSFGTYKISAWQYTPRDSVFISSRPTKELIALVDAGGSYENHMETEYT